MIEKTAGSGHFGNFQVLLGSKEELLVNGSYPAFRSAYSHEELAEHFLLTPIELSLVLRCRGEANRCGMALPLKAVNCLGYVRDTLDMIST